MNLGPHHAPVARAALGGGGCRVVVVELRLRGAVVARGPRRPVVPERVEARRRRLRDGGRRRPQLQQRGRGGGGGPGARRGNPRGNPAVLVPGVAHGGLPTLLEEWRVGCSCGEENTTNSFSLVNKGGAACNRVTTAHFLVAFLLFPSVLW